MVKHDLRVKKLNLAAVSYLLHIMMTDLIQVEQIYPSKRKNVQVSGQFQNTPRCTDFQRCLMTIQCQHYVLSCGTKEVNDTISEENLRF